MPPLDARVSQIRWLQNLLQHAGQQIDAAIGGVNEGEIRGIDHRNNSHALLGEWEFS
jgi:hypothetical protein